MDLSPAQRSISPSRIGLVVLGIAAVILAFYLMVAGRSGAATTELSPRPSSSTTAIPSTTFRGALTPVREARLAAAVSGSVVELPAPVGTVVEVGAPLLRVDGTSQLQAVNVAEADVRRARAALSAARTARGALGKGATPGDRRVAAAEVSVADAAVQLEAAKLAAARAEAALTTLTAPFPGTVTAIQAEIGERVGPGEPVVTLADTTSWLVEALVPEAQLVRLAAGDAAKVAVSAVPELDLSGTILDIALVPSTIGSETGYVVVVEISGSDPRLRSGLAADVSFAGIR